MTPPKTADYDLEIVQTWDNGKLEDMANPERRRKANFCPDRASTFGRDPCQEPGHG
jgi:hypothetical protein